MLKLAGELEIKTVFLRQHSWVWSDWLAWGAEMEPLWSDSLAVVKKWNGTILVRIMKINLGNGTDNTVTIDFEEVIPYLGEMNTSIVVDAPIESASPPF